MLRFGGSKALLLVVLAVIVELSSARPLLPSNNINNNNNNNNPVIHEYKVGGRVGDEAPAYAPGTLLGRWFKLKEKWQLVKDGCGELFDSVKKDWGEIKGTAKRVGKELEEDFEKAKSRTLQLLDNAKQAYQRVVIHGEDAFEHFRSISRDVEESLGHFKEKGGQVFDDLSAVYQTLKQDVDNEEKLLKSGGLSSAWQGLKHNWDNVKTHWDKLGEDFSSMCDSTISDWKKIERDTVVNVNGVARDLGDIKTEMTGLIRDIRDAYRSITVDGNDALRQFNELYVKIKRTFEDLRPVFGKTVDALKLVLKEFKTDAEVVQSLKKGAALSSEGAELVEVVELAEL